MNWSNNNNNNNRNVQSVVQYFIGNLIIAFESNFDKQELYIVYVNGEDDKAVSTAGCNITGRILTFSVGEQHNEVLMMLR